jgi:hypothetical protein
MIGEVILEDSTSDDNLINKAIEDPGCRESTKRLPSYEGAMPDLSFIPPSRRRQLHERSRIAE